jgi:RNA polymerase sigma-70 factor (ECF subfamily)
MHDPSRSNDAGDPLQRLADRAQSGDRGAFEQLLRRFDPGLKRILLRRSGGRVELADELAQRTWIAVWEALRKGRYDPRKSAISTFIYAVAHKLWLQHLRRASTAPLSGGVLGESLLDASGATENPVAELQAAEMLEAMRACLRTAGTPFSLTDEERRIVLELNGGKSERDLAGELGVAASTIHARKQLAYGKLRRCLAAKGFSEETAERRRDDRE